MASPELSTPPPQGWAATNETWLGLDPYQRAAAMSMMEANGKDPEARLNVLGAIINRANADKTALGHSVSRYIYQPTMEATQQARLPRILADPAHAQLTEQARRYATGEEQVPHTATHFLAPEKTMLALEAREPNKYRSWRDWTGFNPATNQYSGVQFRDNSHAFLTPGAPAPDGGAPAPRLTPQAMIQAAASPAQRQTPSPVSSAVPSSVPFSMAGGSPETAGGFGGGDQIAALLASLATNANNDHSIKPINIIDQNLAAPPPIPRPRLTQSALLQAALKGSMP